jgi:hypothetical protein
LWQLLLLFWAIHQEIFKNVQDKVAESQVVVEETMQGISIVKVSMNGTEIARYNGKLKKSLDCHQRWKIPRLLCSFIIFVSLDIVAVVWSVFD